MIRKIAIFLLVCALFFFGSPVLAAEPEVSAYAAILYEPLTGTVIYEKNAEEMLPMASTTKIMTAMLAFESDCLDEEVEITEEMVRTEGSSMGLMPGDVLPLRELAEGMMMTSGNDSANAIALFLSDSTDTFSALMNTRAKEIGMENTSFVTPSGLDAEGHFSTAYDMALLAAEAMKCPAFSETVGQYSLMVDFSKPEKSIRCDNHNKLLHLYEDCTGIKTGFTKKAGRCLVSSAERDGAVLICVTLNAPDDWNDHITLFDYGFLCLTKFEPGKEFVTVRVVGSEKDSLQCMTYDVPELLLPVTCEVKRSVSIPHFIYAPVEKGEKIGTVSYCANDREILSVPLYANEKIEYAAEEKRGFGKWAERLFCRK